MFCVVIIDVIVCLLLLKYLELLCVLYLNIKIEIVVLNNLIDLFLFGVEVLFRFGLNLLVELSGMCVGIV